MLSELTNKGKAALAKINTDFPDKEALSTAFGCTDISSCNATAETIWSCLGAGINPIVCFGQEHALLVGKMLTKLKTSHVLYIQLSPDHRFIVFPIDTDKLIIQQAFQDSYNLLEWRERRGEGVIATSCFREAMLALNGPPGDGATTAAYRTLFTYALSYRLGPAPDEESSAVETKVAKWFKMPIELKQMYYHAL